MKMLLKKCVAVVILTYSVIVLCNYYVDTANIFHTDILVDIGINKKLLGEDVSTYYCMDCLADYLGCEVQDILDKIEEFKEEGCKLFS